MAAMGDGCIRKGSEWLRRDLRTRHRRNPGKACQQTGISCGGTSTAHRPDRMALLVQPVQHGRGCLRRDLWDRDWPSTDTSGEELKKIPPGCRLRRENIVSSLYWIGSIFVLNGRLFVVTQNQEIVHVQRKSDRSFSKIHLYELLFCRQQDKVGIIEYKSDFNSRGGGDKWWKFVRRAAPGSVISLHRAHVKILLRNCVTEMNGYVKLVQDLFPQARPTRRIIA